MSWVYAGCAALEIQAFRNFETLFWVCAGCARVCAEGMRTVCAGGVRTVYANMFFWVAGVHLLNISICFVSKFHTVFGNSVD